MNDAATASVSQTQRFVFARDSLKSHFLCLPRAGRGLESVQGKRALRAESVRTRIENGNEERERERKKKTFDF